MANIIKVDPQRLKIAAGQLAGTSSQVKSATNSMTNTVSSLSGAVWSGDAATAFISKFNGLNDEIKAIDTMIQEHMDDLQKMAATYEKAENTSQNMANTLNEVVF